ncbi:MULTISPECIES: hypothetical protein [Rhizobium]|nr:MULTISPECIES: hypothetical protein [Rhizobium]MBY3558604.1 hypothetical protein [Rhizobium laguerreae]MBY5562960.1 hypothetical protein [Rhizobium leguminosarum]MBY5710568.1 hypothetical protein [Rhizobium leguminosarum]
MTVSFAGKVHDRLRQLNRAALKMTILPELPPVGFAKPRHLCPGALDFSE